MTPPRQHLLPALRALPVVAAPPDRHRTLLVRRDEWEPHLRPGELAVLDETDVEPQLGELYGLRLDGLRAGRAPYTVQIVQPFRSRLADPAIEVAFRFGLAAPGRTVPMQGPMLLDRWRGRCRGRVVAVMVPL